MDHDVLQKIIHNRGVRKKLAMKSHYWFFHIYLSHYVKFKTADFHKEIFNITENENIKDAVIVSFRGSAKSTIMTLSYPLWAMLGIPQKKCIVVASLTQNQSKTLLYQIKNELESNSLLIEDFGPFAEENDAWRADSLIIGPYGTRILAISANESIRGLRHGAYRPDLIICDDVEDINTVKTQEGRDKTYQWFTGELIPMGDINTKVVVIGNLLHEDSLIMRLKEQGNKENKSRIFKSYPLLTNEDNIIWPGKYPNRESIDQERSRVGHIAFQREYLLTIVPDNDIVVRPEWICYYDELPSLTQSNNFRYLAFSVDLAISEKQTADFTAIVSGYVFGIDKDTKIYISPFPINRRMDFPKTIQTILEENEKQNELVHKWFVEDVAYQAAVVQELNQQGLQVKGVKLLGADKRARISQTTNWIQNGKVLFPRKGADQLISQLVSFGVERHDDLADAFSMLILQIIRINPEKARAFGSILKHIDSFIDFINIALTYTTILIPLKYMGELQNNLKYCLYARKSSESDERQAMSIDGQLSEMKTMAKKEKLFVTEIMTESHSAKESGQRPEFNNLLQGLIDDRYNAILTWAPDRLSRNAGDLGRIVDLMDQGKLIKIQTYSQSFSNNPNEKFLLMILCSQAKLENDNRGINVKRGLRNKCEVGIRPGMAPIGYLNIMKFNRISTVGIDPERGPVIKEMFNKVAIEGYSGRMVQKWLRSINFCTRNNCHMALSRIYKVLRTHFYYGNFMYGGKIYKGNYEALISKQVFEKVQLHLDVAPRQWNKQLFPFKKICKCGNCGGSVTAEIKHKKLVRGGFHAHIYYHCNRIKELECHEPYITETELIRQLVTYLPNLKLNVPFLMQECKNDIKRLQNLKSAVLREKSPRLELTPHSSKKNIIEFENTEYSEDQIEIVKEFLLHILKFGTPEERVKILGGIESKFILKDRRLIQL